MTTEERLERLECQLRTAQRRYRRLLIAAVLAAGTLALVWTSRETGGASPAAATPPLETVRARSFVLVDEQGRTRGKLCSNKDDAPALCLYNADGTPCVALQTDRTGPSLYLQDKPGTPRASLAPSALKLADAGDLPGILLESSPEKGTALRLHDAKDSHVTLEAAQEESCLIMDGPDGRYATILVSGAEESSLNLADANGKFHTSLTTDSQRSALTFSDDKGFLRTTLALEPTGSLLRFRDKDNQPRLLSAETPDGAAMTLYDKANTLRLYMEADPTKSVLTLYDKNSKPRTSLVSAEDTGGLRLYDTNEHPCVILDFNDENGPLLCLQDGKDKALTSLNPSALRIDAAHGKNRILLATNPQNGSVLHLNGETNPERIILAALPDGTLFSLCDENGKLRACMGARKQEVSFSLNDENERVLWSAP